MPLDTTRLGGKRYFVLLKEVEVWNRFLQEWSDYTGVYQGAPPGWDTRNVTSYFPASLGSFGWPCRPYGGMYAMHYVQTGFYSLFEHRAQITIDPSSNPEFFAPGTHSAMAAMHTFPMDVGTSGAASSDYMACTVAGSKVKGSVVASSLQYWKQSCVWPRYLGGGSHLERYWTGSKALILEWAGPGDVSLGARGMIANLIIGMDGVEIGDHQESTYGGAVKRTEHLSMGGRMYGLTFNARRKWKLRLDNLSSIDWTRVNSWVFNGHKLVLAEVETTSAGANSLPTTPLWMARVSVSNKATPAGVMVPGNADLRRGYINLEESLEGM